MCVWEKFESYLQLTTIYHEKQLLQVQISNMIILMKTTKKIALYKNKAYITCIKWNIFRNFHMTYKNQMLKQIKPFSNYEEIWYQNKSFDNKKIFDC